MTESRCHALILFVVTMIMFWWRLGQLPLIDPDEPFYAQTTREMVQHNDWITPQIFGQPQFEKPIFFYWQSMTAQKMFGDTEFAARVPSAAFATLLVFLTWVFGRRFLSPQAGFYAALILATGMEFAFMARLMLTDICLAFLVSASVFSFWMSLQDEAKRDLWVFLQFTASGFAALTKGPIGLIIPALGSVLYLYLTKTRSPWRGRGLVLGIGAWLVITVPWYATMFAKFGREYWEKFFVHENWERLIHAEHDHSNHVWYYPMMLFVGSLPWIPLLVAAVVRTFTDAKRDKRVLFIVCWIVPNLIFFTIAQSKLPTYVFFLFVAIALLMGLTLDSWLRDGFRNKYERILVTAFSILQVAALLGAASYIGILVPSDSNAFIKDLLPVAYAVSAMLALPMILLFAGKPRAWALATVGVSTGIFMLALTQHADGIGRYASTQGIASRVAALRRPNEPVVSAPFLARAVTYYTHETPAGVSFLRDGNKRKMKVTQPYFSPHPLNILLDESGLNEFASRYPSVLCITQVRDRERINGEKSVLHGRIEELVTLGDRCIFRITIPKRVPN